MDLTISPLSVQSKYELLHFLDQLDEEDRLFFYPHAFSLPAIEDILANKVLDQYFLAHDIMGATNGYCMLRGWDEGYTTPSIGICVSKSSRGMGVGKSLLAFLLQVAARLGASKAMLKVHRHNIAAIKIYRQFGFLIEDTHADHMVGSIELDSKVLSLASRLYCM